ncbi:MAG: phospholipase D-like domain-containing protein [Bacteroidota bacterium]
MPALLLCIPFLLQGAFSPPRQAGFPGFELVESVPVETGLDNGHIRNTPEVWREMIGGARRTLEVEQFYISSRPGTAFDSVLGEVRRAALRGVRVRILVDGRMYRTYPADVDSLGRSTNIAVRVLPHSRLSGGTQHAKFFVVDGEEVFLGSQNFDWRALDHIHELGLRVRDLRAAGWYGAIFETDWRLADTSGNPAPPPPPERVSFSDLTLPGIPSDSLVFSPTGSPRHLIPHPGGWDEPAIVRLLDEARRDVCMHFLTFSPLVRGGSRYDALAGAMRRAAAPGV